MRNGCVAVAYMRCGEEKKERLGDIDVPAGPG